MFDRRYDIFISKTLKLIHDGSHSPDLVPHALNKTLSDLGLTYLDLYLMHWPVSSENGTTKIDYIDTWKGMTKLLSTGKVRHIGVSNFSPPQLQALMDSTPQYPPYAHQMELHPYLQQTEWLEWHRLNGIHVTAYSPFGNTNPTYTSWRKGNAAVAVPPLLENDLIVDIASNRGCTPAQVALQWGMLRGTSVIPKSMHTDRIDENYKSLDCHLEQQDIDRIDTDLPTKRFNNPSSGWGVDLFEGLQDVPSSKGLGDLKALGRVVAGMKSALAKVRRLLRESRDL